MSCSKMVLSSGKRDPINALAVTRPFIPETAEKSAVLKMDDQVKKGAINSGKKV